MSTGNPGYSPLPQSNSDSDGSEEELHISQGSNFSSRSVEVEVSKSAETATKKKNNVIRYKPLDDDRHVGETFAKFQSGLDEVFIQKSNSSEKFSTFRKIGFVFSLFLCVFTTIAFMWILPCNIESCPVVGDMEGFIASDSKSGNYTWKKILPNLEMIGPCSLVSDSFSRNQNLVFLARSYLNLDKKYVENFLLSLKGEDGSLNWRVKFEREPTIVDCRLIDIDLDGLNDCLLFEKKYITTINSVTGKEIWSSHSLKIEREHVFLNFPIVLPDIDNDTVNDLLLSYSFTNNSQKLITIVSGKTGKALGELYQINFCKTLHTLMPSNGTILFFTCHNFTKESVYKVNLMDMIKTIRSTSKQKVNFSSWEKLQQHEKYSNTVSLNSLELILENQGNCPETCSVLVNIKDKQKNCSSKSVYSLTSKNTFGMTPVKFKSKQTSGFILKLWEWNGETGKNYFQNNAVYAQQNFSEFDIITKQMPRENKNLNVTDLDQEMLLENEQSFKRCKRTANNFHKQENETNLRLITETLVKITFNNTHPSIKKMCEHEIIQICEKPHICHPDVNQQKHSILVACFNGNKREKLVTYTSENIKSKINKSWQIQSEIQMLDCE